MKETQYAYLGETDVREIKVSYSHQPVLSELRKIS